MYMSAAPERSLLVYGSSAERPAEALTAQELRLLQLRFSPAPCRRQEQRAWTL
jgi:hypothetical protein